MQSLERDLLQSTTLQKYPDFVALAEEIKIMETKIDTDVNKQPPEGTMIFLQERFDRIFNKIAPKLSPETRKKIKEQRGEKMK